MYLMKKKLLLLLVMILAVSILGGCGNIVGHRSLTNVSYDPTRELYEEYNRAFIDYWRESSGETVDIIASHGGSGSQALAVANGLDADVVTLALEADVNSIEDAGLIEPGWIDEFPNDSSPYTSTIVFLVRAGNPCGITDWDDLVRDGVGVITPNPKTSGGARWNFLAAWAYAEKQYGGQTELIEDFMARLFGNVLVLDSGARGSTTTFAENGQGDVLIAWENEAYLLLREYPDDYEIISPSVSILCQPSVAIVDEVADYRGSQDLAAAYLDYLYSEKAQHIIAGHYYRPSSPEILAEYGDVFDLDMEMVTIEHFGGWRDAQVKYFGDGGVFDRIYEN